MSDAVLRRWMLRSAHLMRLFVAIDLPDDRAEALLRIDPAIGGLRWSRRETLHLTLVFLGEVEVSDERLDRLQQELAGVNCPGFDLRLRGLGCFGGKRGRPLVLWAGVEDPEGALVELHGRVVDAVRAAGLEDDRRRFRPHVTLARSRRVGRPAIEAWLKPHSDLDFGSFEVRSFVLYSSTLSPAGATHRPVCRFPLTAPS